MYDATPDPFCYPGTSVLKNIPGIRNQAELDRFETAITAQRGEEPLPLGRFGVSHYRAIYHHLFQDVYPWAGRFRTLRIAKGESVFCYPEHIAAQMSGTFAELKKNRYLRDLPPETFATQAAHFLAALNAIHPFRDGNGRTQLAFTAMLAAHAGHSLALERLEPEPFLAAMIRSFQGNERLLADEITTLLVP